MMKESGLCAPTVEQLEENDRIYPDGLLNLRHRRIQKAPRSILPRSFSYSPDDADNTIS